MHHYPEPSTMQGISDIKIIGIDAKRPPRVRKEPYIDLFFQLSLQAPKDWCDDFNMLAGKLDPAIRVEKNEGLFIETYVRDMNHIAEHLEIVKKKIIDCNEKYIERIGQHDSAAMKKNASLLGDGGEQGKLNKIIATLDFDH
jgi:hypothetical protein